MFALLNNQAYSYKLILLNKITYSNEYMLYVD